MLNTHPILQETSIKSMPVINRFVLAPMSRASATDDGVPTAAMARYYAGFARGGFGLLIAEGAFTDSIWAQCYSNQPGMATDAQQAGWRDVVSAVKAEGGRIILQLIHAGAVSQHVMDTVAPSAVRPAGQMLQGYGHRQGDYDVPAELTIEQIDIIRTGFIKAAQRAEQAGFDGVEIHCANGYLLDQFLTEDTNLRMDQYGGSLQNRLRLTNGIITGVKDVTGHGFITGVRLSQAKANRQDYLWPNGLEDAEIIFKGVAEAGADFIHLASEKDGYEVHSYTADGQNLTEFARKLTGLPVIANGGLQDMDLANRIISSGQADMISIGKTAMLNPDLPKRIAAGRELRDFTFDMFKYGVTVEGQLRWQAEEKGRELV